MANEIPLGPGTYLIAFANAQGTPPIANYFAAPGDLDINFVTLRDTVNQLIREFRGLTGPSSLFGSDLMFIDAQGSSPPNTETGRIGAASAVLTIDAAPVNLLFSAGAMSILGQRTPIQAQVLSAAALAPDTYFIGIDINGIISSSTLPVQQLADIATVTVVGNEWIAITDELETFFDGDEYFTMRTRPAAGTSPESFDARTFGEFHDRVEAIERMIAGFTTDGLTNALGQPAIRAGVVGTPGLTVNGDPDTGFFSPGANQLAIVTGGAIGIEVNAARVVTAPSQPAGYVSQATQAITTGAGQAISYGTELFDRANQHATVNLEIIAGQAGIYEINAESFAQVAGGGVTPSTVSLTIVQEGTIRSTDAVDSSGSGDVDHQLKCSVVLELAVNDTIQVIATQGSGSSMTFSTNRLSWAKIA